jgi:transposase
VGQIYEKGLGTAASPERAADWYRKAAEQGYRSAQVSLGYLYETGSGVAADDTEALRWYRRAAGTSEDLVVLAERDYAALLVAQEDLREKRDEVEQMSGEIVALQQQLTALENASETDRQRRHALATLLARLRKDIASRENDVVTQQDHIAALQTAAQASTSGAGRGSADASTVDVSKLAFGRYHALVIGNRHYRALPETPTAATDARGIASLLESQYGFEVELLIDATRFDIMSALNRLRTELDENDHLLVYYAGHGVRDADGETAYWQPIDADPKSPANWIPSAVVTEHLDIIPARHVFVVADSVYSGLRTRSSVARLPQGMTTEQRYFHIKGLLERRVRLVLAAGSEQPVVDRDTADRSRFTRTLLDVLRSNEGILEASSLYFELNRRLADDPARPRLRVDFATLKWARNDLGDFFFVPNRS